MTESKPICEMHVIKEPSCPACYPYKDHRSEVPPSLQRWLHHPEAEKFQDSAAVGETQDMDVSTPEQGCSTLSTIQIVHDILNQAIDEVGDRATLYDKPQGEESMPTVVQMFNVLYGASLTVEQGWMFMTILKQVRSSNGDFKMDNYVDLAAYSAFAGKAAQDESFKRTR